MPRDFKSFVRDNQNTNSSKNILEENKEEASKYEEIINKYKNMNQKDLMSNLFSEANKLKKDGKLDANTLNNLKSTLSPFLNDGQQEMLNNLINAINEQK